MNLYRVTRTDVGGGHPYTTIFHDREMAFEEFEYLERHTYFQAQITGFFSTAAPTIIDNLSL